MSGPVSFEVELSNGQIVRRYLSGDRLTYSVCYIYIARIYYKENYSAKDHMEFYVEYLR